MGALDNITGDMANAFGDRPVGLPSGANQFLRDWGVYPPVAGGGTWLQRLNENYLVGGTASVVDATARSVPAVYAGGQRAVYEGLTGVGAPDNLARDVVSMPDAFLGSPLHGVPSGGGAMRTSLQADARAAGGEARAAGADARAAGADARAAEEANPCTTCRTAKEKEKDGKNITREEDADPSVRDPSGVVRRGDTRTPEQIEAAGGFYGHDPGRNIPLEDHMPQGREPSAWVSATDRQYVADGFSANPFPQGQRGIGMDEALRTQANGSGYTYNIYQPGGVMTEALTPPLQYGNGEISFSNGIPFNNVHSWYPVNGGTPGALVRNPSYTGPSVPAFGD